MTKLTQELSKSVERATLAAAEVESLKLDVAQGACCTPPSEDLPGGSRSMLGRLEGTVHDLTLDLSAAREELARSKGECDVLRQRDAKLSAEQQAVHMLRLAAETAESKLHVAEQRLLRVEGERDDALKSLADAVALQESTAAALEAMRTPQQSSKAVWVATTQSLRDRITGLEGEATVLQHKVDTAQDDLRLSQEALHAMTERHAAECEHSAAQEACVKRAALEAEDYVQQVEQLTLQAARAHDLAETRAKERDDALRRGQNDGLEAAPLVAEVAELTEQLQAARLRTDAAETQQLADAEALRAAVRSVDALEQELSESAHAVQRLEEELAEYQATVTSLTEDLSAQRRMATSAVAASPASSDVYALRIRCAQLEKEVSALRTEEACDGSEASVSARDEFRLLSESEGAVLAERVGTTLRVAAEVLDVCPLLRALKDVRSEVVVAGLTKLVRALEALVRTVQRKMQHAEDYLVSFTAHIGNLHRIGGTKGDALTIVLLGYHREVWCGGADAAHMVLEAAQAEARAIVSDSTAAVTAERLATLLEQLGQARADADALWVSHSFTPSVLPKPLEFDTPQSATRAAAAPDTPSSVAGGSREENTLRRDITKLRSENKRLYTLVKSLKAASTTLPVA